MEINLQRAAQTLAEAQDILLIAHKSPDGDTLGSCYALYYALTGMGKRARVACSDPVTKLYAYLKPRETPSSFDPRCIVSVDVADEKLFGEKLEPYCGRVDLCIDHHQTNTDYARERLVDPTQAATAQIVYKIIVEMRRPITPMIADCLFTGLTTDTGCFRYASVTAETHRIAADLMEHGARAEYINRVMFEQKSRQGLRAERMAMDSLHYSFGGRCAEVFLSQEIFERTGADEDSLAGIPALLRQIEGVLVSVTYKERDGGIKISLRTGAEIDASKVCAAFGGGGHCRAAGCFIEGNFDEARQRMHSVLERYLS